MVRLCKTLNVILFKKIVCIIMKLHRSAVNAFQKISTKYQNSVSHCVNLTSIYVGNIHEKLLVICYPANEL